MPCRPILGKIHYLAAELQARSVPGQGVLPAEAWTETEESLIQFASDLVGGRTLPSILEAPEDTIRVE
eukprot:3824415-Amphidinium_carterae.1